jgi:hypothetical protein
MNYMDDILAKQAYMQKNMPKKDPFDQGIMRAVKSAKQSLEMDDDQSDRAMRESMATFAENIAPMPKVKGFMANFAQAGRALAPAIQTHDAYEDQAKEKNKQMIAYAQQLRAAEEAKAAALEANAYSREMADRQMAFQQQQLAEQREYHKLSLEVARAKAEAKAEKERNNSMPVHNVDERGLVDGKYVPFTNKKDRDLYSKKLAGTNVVKTHLLDAKNILDQFDKKYEGTLLNSPIVGSHLGKSKSIIGHFSRNAQMIKEANDRALLDQSIGTIATKFEKELKGGILTGDIIKRFQSMGIVPVAGDSPELMKTKLAQMLKVAEEEKDIAERSLVNNYHYAPSDNAKLADYSMGNTDHIQHQNNDTIKMINPETNEGYTISKDDVEALKILEIKGFKPVGSKLNKSNNNPIDTEKQDNTQNQNDSLFGIRMQGKQRPLYLRYR